MVNVMDPRAERSREALRESVFRIASERRIETVTTTEVARDAGVTRGTVYNHGKSPAELLQHLLAEELTELRERFWRNLGKQPVRESFEAGVRDAVDHVTAHLAIYERALAHEPSPAIHHVLSDHFASTLSDFFRANPSVVTVPPGFDREENFQTTADSLAAYAAHGVVGTIEVWLRQGSTRNTELLVATINSILPAWYFESPETSEISTT
ncbi:MAG: putative TetR family transcriptional regulator [Subtercola sp.]|nr:putative TetR family transcriptional regulator [Subtercola sp.]